MSQQHLFNYELPASFLPVIIKANKNLFELLNVSVLQTQDRNRLYDGGYSREEAEPTEHEIRSLIVFSLFFYLVFQLHGTN